LIPLFTCHSSLVTAFPLLYIYFSRPDAFGRQTYVEGRDRPAKPQRIFRMIAPGTVLQNRYHVERQIGEGGMGAVYVATDRRFGSTVAIKETFFDDAALRKAFEREARLLNHLRHTALPRVSDHFEEGEGQFLVMEFIPGEDLSRMLKQRGGPFPLDEVLAWADQLLDALDYLHTQEPPVIHRDIKPQNLKLLPRNQIVLLDFGLAKGTPLQTRVTATGSVFGYSFNYAPIEQMQGTGTDPRSDLYSLGATVYHLLTASPPPDALARATAVLNGEPDPLRPASELNANVNAAVAEVLARAMRQSAAQRFATAAEMRAALRQAGQRIALGEDAATHQSRAQQTNFLHEQQGLFESETRLMNPPVTNRIPLAETEELLDETAVAGKQNDAAIAGTGFVKGSTPTREGEARTPQAASSGEVSRQQTLAASGAREEKSVVTKVKTGGVAPDARGGSRRALGVAAGAVFVALVAAAVYSFARRDASNAPAAQATPQPAATSQPAGAAQPSAPSQQTPAPSDNTQATDAAREHDATRADAQPRHTPAAPARNASPQDEGPPPDDRRPVPPQPPPLDQAEERNGADEPGSPFHNRDMRNNPPSPEEVDRWLAQHPHWLENHPNRARQLMRLRQLQQQQQRRRNNSPPPPF
jgi:serine/threonine protein kinase